MKKVENAILALRDAICRDALPWRDPIDGGTVGDATEAIIFLGQAILEISKSLDNIADAIREGREP